MFWSSGHFLLFLTGPGACVVPTLGWFVIISDLHVWGPAVADWRAVEIQIPRVKLQLLSPYAHPSALKQSCSTEQSQLSSITDHLAVLHPVGVHMLVALRTGHRCVQIMSAHCSL